MFKGTNTHFPDWRCSARRSIYFQFHFNVSPTIVIHTQSQCFTNPSLELKIPWFRYVTIVFIAAHHQVSQAQYNIIINRALQNKVTRAPPTRPRKKKNMYRSRAHTNHSTSLLRPYNPPSNSQRKHPYQPENSAQVPNRLSYLAQKRTTEEKNKRNIPCSGVLNDDFTSRGTGELRRTYIPFSATTVAGST